MNPMHFSDALQMDNTKPKISPLKQHPVLPLLPLSSGPPSATQTLIVNYPAAKLSSSPASSPNIVEPSIERKGSVHPTLGNSMERGVSPGVDFFDDQSSGSEWEDADDEDRTQSFSLEGGAGLGLGSLVHSHPKHYRGSRGRSLERSGLTALPQFEETRSNGTQSDPRDEGAKKARHVSLTRMEKATVKVVHNHGSNNTTPRGSIMSSSSVDTATHFPEITKPFPNDARGGETFPHEHVQGRHRRNTSDSIIADSIINAHLTTMRALKALSPSGSIPDLSGHSFYSATTANLPKARSFSDARHIKLLPISVKDREHLPSHFVKTPYPFTAKKEFPRPATRPRHHNVDGRLDSGYGDSGCGGEGSGNEFSDLKGKQVLGLMTSGGAYDLRSRLDRNIEAQGVFRTQESHLDTHSPECVLHLSLQKHQTLASRKQAKLIIPSDLSTTSPDRRQAMDFDDKYFAERLRHTHGELAGSWAKRYLSARKLRYICLFQNSTWSDSPSRHVPEEAGTSRLLASGAGTDLGDDAPTFTEEKLMRLYKYPKIGKARYTWVHWARRVALSNTSKPARPRTSASSHQQHSVLESEHGDKEDSVIHHHITVPSDTITTMQFVHTLSTSRILVALALVFATSAFAALAWIFLGVNGGWLRDVERQRADRVGSGMGIGVLVLLLELMGFGAWVWRS